LRLAFRRPEWRRQPNGQQAPATVRGRSAHEYDPEQPRRQETRDHGRDSSSPYGARAFLGCVARHSHREPAPRVLNLALGERHRWRAIGRMREQALKPVDEQPALRLAVDPGLELRQIFRRALSSRVAFQERQRYVVGRHDRSLSERRWRWIYVARGAEHIRWTRHVSNHCASGVPCVRDGDRTGRTPPARSERAKTTCQASSRMKKRTKHGHWAPGPSPAAERSVSAVPVLCPCLPERSDQNQLLS